MAADDRKPVFRIASIPGDGIGPEVVSAAITVLRKLAAVAGTFELEFAHLDWGTDRYRTVGAYMPEDGIAQLRGFDAVFFGSVGALDVPDHISLWGLILPIRHALQQYANLRPVRILRGVTSPLTSCTALSSTAPQTLDWLLVRENTEGEYAGQGGRTHVSHPWETGTEVAIFTRHGCTRILRFAFQLASQRARRHLTVVTKSNAMRNGMVLWDEVAREVARDFPDVAWEKVLVDAMTVRMVLQPASLDTIVATNLHADILSDLAAALAGSIGIAPSSNVDPDRTAPGLFEPVHGSAFELVGKDVANPVGAIWSGGEMVRWLLRREREAEGLLEAVERVAERGVRTRDLGGSAGTREVADAVSKELERVFGEGK